VDCYPWGEDAFTKAQAEYKSIFLSVILAYYAFDSMAFALSPNFIYNWKRPSVYNLSFLCNFRIVRSKKTSHPAAMV
jgi:hypothetical protein